MNPNNNDGQCPHCKQSNSLTNRHCDFCGERLPWATSPSKSAIPKDAAILNTPSSTGRTWMSITMGVAAFAVLAAIGFLVLRHSGSTPPGEVENTSGIAASATALPGSATAMRPQADTSPSNVTNTSQQVAPAPAQSHTVTYRVTGQVRYSHGRAKVFGDSPEGYSESKGGAIGPPQIANIMTSGGGSNLTQGLVQRLPWSATFSANDAHLKLSASTDASWVASYGSQNGLSYDGTLVAEISVDGVVVAHQESEGDIGSVECEWTVGQDPRSHEDFVADDHRSKDKQIAALNEDITFLRAQRIAIIANAERDALTPDQLKFRVDGKDRQIADKQAKIAALQSSR